MKADKTLIGAGQKQLDVIGTQEAQLKYEERSTTQQIYYVKGLKHPLVGRPAIEKLKLFRRINVINKNKFQENQIGFNVIQNCLGDQVVLKMNTLLK